MTERWENPRIPGSNRQPVRQAAEAVQATGRHRRVTCQGQNHKSFSPTAQGCTDDLSTIVRSELPKPLRGRAKLTAQRAAGTEYFDRKKCEVKNNVMKTQEEGKRGPWKE